MTQPRISVYVPGMSTTTFAALLPTVCQAAMSITTSVRSTYWFIVSYFGFWGWVIVIALFLIWGTIELLFRFGSSSNGFSWEFNVAVGSLTFAVFQSLVYLFFDKLFGNGVYCLPWPYPFHLLVFPSVWLFLRAIGFWNH